LRALQGRSGRSWPSTQPAGKMRRYTPNIYNFRY
jgi:hypothetical protein